MFGYLGPILLLSWHYSLWFVPEVFPHTPLLDDAVTLSWIISLGSSALALLLIPLAMRRKRHLTSYPALGILLPLLLTAGTLYLTQNPYAFDNLIPLSLVSGVLGVGCGALWIYVGEYCVKHRNQLKVVRIAALYGATLLFCLAATTLLPAPLGPGFVACLPLAAGAALIVPHKDNCDSQFPLPLPTAAGHAALRPVLKVCLIALVTGFSCYFLLAIIPWESLPLTDKSFTLGVGVGALVMLLLAGLARVAPRRSTIFRLVPWLLVLVILAFALFLADKRLDLPAFLITVAVTSVLELLLIIYFGHLTLRGYVAAALAFGLCAGCARLGFTLGNLLAVAYEHATPLAQSLIVPTSLACVALLLVLLITLIRQEYHITALFSTPLATSDISCVCTEVAREFSLSAREAEILGLMSCGYTSNTIADKLFISPFTVNTHIQHIYEKIGIHKKSELLNYLNTLRGDLQPTPN